MKKACIAITAFALVVCAQSSSWGAPDTYIGDAAIYSALDTGPDRPKPHVLLLIDTSRATLNRASGVAYNPDQIYSGPYHQWGVYFANTQGNFPLNNLVVYSATSALEGITCSAAVIKNSLLSSGTYSGSGTSDFPSLVNQGNSAGACRTGNNQGGAYALGNFLNYLASDAGHDSAYRHIYTCQIASRKGQGNNFDDPVTVENGCVGIFSPVKDHDGSLAEAIPGVGSNWREYWVMTEGGCIPGVGNCASNSSPPAVAVPEIELWSSNQYYTASTGAGGTQREIIYNALAQVVDGARFAVKFGAITYSQNNKGGNVAYHMSDLSNDATFNAFLTALPGPGENDGAPLVNSNTARPMAEALYDAGYYLGVKYPAPNSSYSIPTNAVFPLDGSNFGAHKISPHMPTAANPAHRNECEYNHIILITNGLPRDDDAMNLERLIDAAGDGRTLAEEKVYGQGSHFLDDVAAFLYKQEGIVTHTVLAFQSADPLIQTAAYVGGGTFHNVYNANELAEALTKLLAGIVLEVDTSFVAPVVPASSTNRTISSNRVYLGLFKPQMNRPWLGNLKKYGVSSNLTLLDRSNAEATDQYGDFLPNSKSYWGDDGTVNQRIMSISGLLPESMGDGGEVAAGGVGGTLLLDLLAGRENNQKAWEVRNIYTWVNGTSPVDITSANNRFSPANTHLTADILDVSEGERDKLIAFVAGADGYDDNNNGDATEIRDWVLGDILHSKPLIFNYSGYTAAQENNCDYNKGMIYVGSNDGMFHAFRDCDGSEAWAFIPDNVLPNLRYLRQTEHYYFLDSPPTAYVHDVNGNNIIETNLGDKVVLIFGQGRGGGRSTLDANGSRGAYYALDVSNPDQPVLLWRIDSDTSGFGELGQTWSPPRLAKVRVGAEVKVVAFVGAGYDNNEDLRFGSNMLFPGTTTASTNTTLPTGDAGNVTSSGSSQPFNPRGRGIYAIEIATLRQGFGACSEGVFCPDFSSSGSLVWSFVHQSGNGMNYSIPSDLTVLDMSGNGFQDRIYVGDTGGRIWRFDVGSTNTADWTASARMIFKSNKDGETNTGRKIFYRPTVALAGGYPTLYFGTGDRNHPLNTAVTDRMFSVKDKGQTTPVDIDDLVNLTENRLQASNATTDEILQILGALGAANKYGWYIDLNENAGEKVLASALVFNRQVFYTTYTPSPSDDLDACQVGNLGTSRLYHLDYYTAEAVFNYDIDNDNSTAYADNERIYGGDGIALMRSDRVRNIGVGIPSGIVTLIDASGKVTLMISSSNRVGTYQAPDARMMTPLYWMQF